MLKHYLPHLIFFSAFFAAAVPVLYYIQRKNPYPRFRPNFGEMSLMTLIAAFICGGMAFGLGSLMKPENDGRGSSNHPGFDGAAAAGGNAAPGGGGSGKSKQKDRKSNRDDAPRRTLHDRL